MTRPDRDAEESRRIIARVGHESEASMARRVGERARGHMAADDADQSDWVEVWGTRIGRALGLVFLLVLIYWLVSLLITGA